MVFCDWYRNYLFVATFISSFQKRRLYNAFMIYFDFSVICYRVMSNYKTTYFCCFMIDQDKVFSNSLLIEKQRLKCRKLPIIVILWQAFYCFCVFLLFSTKIRRSFPFKCQRTCIKGKLVNLFPKSLLCDKYINAF